MCGILSKKVNASLTRLQGVGGIDKKETSLASNNPLAILARLLPSKGDTAKQIINSKLNYLLYLYYEYVKELHLRPLDWEEFIDGVAYLGVKAELRELYRSK